MIRRLSNKYGGARQQACRTLARAVAVGKILYGAPIYTFSSPDIRNLERLHRTTLRTITGLPKHTRISALERAGGLPPLQDVIREAHIRHHIRMENTPQGRRLLAWDCQRHDDAPVLNQSLPPWETPIASRRFRRPISRHNDTARQVLATRQLREATLDTIDIYTDAAFSDGQASVAWICAQTTEYTGAYRCHLPNGTPMHAELLAIWGATASLPYTIQKPLRVFTDSHAAYSEIFRPASEDATAAAIQSILRRHEKADRPIEIIWTPGHTGVPGGNTAAHAAAASAGGSTNLSLPPPLRVNPYELLSQMAPSVATMHYVRTSLRHASKKRITQVTPPVLFSSKCPLSRSQEVFINKVYANSADTPYSLAKWRQPDIATVTCNHCGLRCRADLHHLLWQCSAFDKGRMAIQALQYTHYREALLMDPDTQLVFAQYGSQSDLIRAV